MVHEKFIGNLVQIFVNKFPKICENKFSNHKSKERTAIRPSRLGLKDLA